MAQFDVYWNAAESIWLVDIQHDLLSDLSTRIVVPLFPKESAPRQINRLNPVVRIGDTDHVLMTDLTSAVPRNMLGEAKGNISPSRDHIVAAIDLLVTGI